MARKWKGLYLGTNDHVPVLEKIAREKDAAYVYMQLGNIKEMLRKLNITLRMQQNYSNFSKKEVPSFVDFESMRKQQSIPVIHRETVDNFGNNY